VLPVDRETVERAKQLVLQYSTLPVRAALHVATMQRHGIEQVLSFDPAFDRVPGLTRLR
jgi:predicted nucleic acid-binding protein